MKGSEEPLDLFTCDVEFADLALDPLEKRKTKREVKLQRVRGRIARERLRQMAFDGQLQVSTKFETDTDIIEMRKMYNQVIHFHLYQYLIQFV